MFERNKKHVFTKIPFALCVGEGSSTNTFWGVRGWTILISMILFHSSMANCNHNLDSHKQKRIEKVCYKLDAKRNLNARDLL